MNDMKWLYVEDGMYIPLHHITLIVETDGGRHGMFPEETPGNYNVERVLLKIQGNEKKFYVLKGRQNKIFRAWLDEHRR